MVISWDPTICRATLIAYQRAPGCPPFCMTLPPAVGSTTVNTLRELDKSELGFPAGFRCQLSQKERIPTQIYLITHNSWNLLFHFSFWGFLHSATSLPRTEAGGVRGKGGKWVFPASGQLQITHFWLPETSLLSIYFGREINLGTRRA